MLHNTLSAILVSVASRYAKLSPSDVGIGIGGGHLVIDDVQLRVDALNGPHTPFDVQHGRAGRLRVNVPWGALSSSPVQIYLENVHLIATPKQTSVPITNKIKSSTTSSSSSRKQHPWHQSNVGRLLFNVSIEIYGLKVEYRDPHCIGVLSVASLRAYSAGPDWSMRFVSLVPDLDHETPDASAVAMRKTVNLTGVHFVMIPRTTETANVADNQQTEITDITTPDRRNLDLNSFESQNPILDGVSIALRVLFCTGATVLPETGLLTPGLHGEVFVEIDEPSVKLTARQLLWIEDILRQALGNQNDNNVVIDTTSSSLMTTSVATAAAAAAAATTTTQDSATKRTRTTTSNINEHQQQENDDHGLNVVDGGDENKGLLGNNNNDGLAERNSQSAPEVRQREHQKEESKQQQVHKSSSGTFRSVWDAIVGENTDDMVDDAAYALGLIKREDEKSKRKRSSSSRSSSSSSSSKRRQQTHGDDDNGHEHIDTDEEYNGDDNVIGDDDDDDDDDDDNEEEDEDVKYARRCVYTAAACGGVSWHVRLRTSDTKAWDRVGELERQVSNMEKVEDELRSRNRAVANELSELESMASHAAKDKDELIRQLQSALAEAHAKLRNTDVGDVGREELHTAEEALNLEEQGQENVDVVVEEEANSNDLMGPSEGETNRNVVDYHGTQVVDENEEEEEDDDDDDDDNDGSGTGTVVEHDDNTTTTTVGNGRQDENHIGEDELEQEEEAVVVLPDDTITSVEKIEDMEMAENNNNNNNNNINIKTQPIVQVDLDLAQNASLQSFYNNGNDVSKLEQRMGVEGLTLI